MQLKTTINILLPIIILIEAFSLLFLHKQGITGTTFNAILHFISSASIGILIILKFYNRQYTIADTKNEVVKKNTSIILLLLATAWVVIDAGNIFKQIAIDINWSDIIPAIQIITKRFIAGENPYAPMLEIGYSGPVGYMPFHWLPFCIAEFLKVDYRWISISILIIAITTLFFRLLKYNTNAAILILVLISVSYFLTSRYGIGIMAVTVELLIAGYYIIFTIALNKKNYLFAGITLSLCLLSRYSLIFWLPMAVFVLCISNNKNYLLKTAIVSLIIVLLCYIIPFLSNDWGVLFKTNSGYANMDYEWSRTCENNVPACNLFNGIGFAHLFYKHYGQANFQIAFVVCRTVFFIASIGVCLLMGIWYWKYKTSIDHRIFLMASLKIYLSVFFAFMIVPYDYLMITGLFVSIALYAEQARYKASER
ncbi:hypothetical protein CAP35_10210 [Chitinophagaceae bacterium IBVUCB1]|nr:hypothetical protein CAP35_10210 [Chitinophagaceae bacterium IBVUCB1]